MAVTSLTRNSTGGGSNTELEKEIARSAVLREQRAQRESGIDDPEAIAAAYLEVSAPCLHEAKIRGQKDQQDSLRANFNLSLNSIPKAGL